MRICFVATEYPPGPMGGAGTYTLLMTKLLAQAGHEVTLLTKRLDPQSPEYEDHGALQIFRLPVYYEYTGAAERADDELFCIEMHWVRSFVGIYAREVSRKINQLHRDQPFDVVLTQDLEAPTWIIQDRRMLFAEHLELPFVCFIHSPHWQIQQYNNDSRYDRHEYHRYLYEKQSMSQAEGIIASSRYMKKEVEEQLGLDPSRVDVIPLPLGGCPPKATFSNRYSESREGRKRLVYSGRIELRKGVEVLLRAVVPLLQSDPDLELHLIGRDMPHPTLGGDSTRDKLLNKIVPNDLRERVVFRGAVSRDALWHEFGKATVGVIPSLWEPFSFVCQEMMATAAPVVATRTGGMADMIEDGVSGLLCEPGSVESLEAALRKALYASPEQRRSWGEAAATRIHQFCDSQLVVDRTVESLQRAIERNKRERLELGRVTIPGNLPFGDEPAWQPNRPATPAPKRISKVGVVVPVYNLGQYLGECLDSVEAQSFRDYTIFVVNDGSTDSDTLEAIEIAARRPQVEVSHFPNGGLPVARNRGARLAIERGCDALVFLDCDDMIRPSYLEKAAKVLSLHPEAGAVTAWTEAIGLMHTYWAPAHGQFPFMLAECMSTPAAMVRTSAYQAVGGIDEDLKYAYEDWNFWIRLCGAGFPMLMIPEPLLIYRMRKGSTAQMYNAVTREHGRVHMVSHHEKLFRRYAPDVVLLQDGLLYREQQRYDRDLKNLKQENEVLRKDRDLKIVDVEWAHKEWRHWKRLYEEEQARHHQTSARLAEIEGATQTPER